ncbi:MAG: DUF3782 domain-containing protein [candidate division WOR-3 bacterium]
MIEKINKILERLPEEYRDSIREIVEIIIKEEIEQNRKMIQELWDIIREGNKVNERLWKTVEVLGKRIDKLTKVSKEQGKRINRLEKALIELTERVNNLTQAIEEMRKANQEQFERINKKFDEMKKYIDNKISSLGARWGIESENTFRNSIAYLLKDIGFKVEKLIFFDDEGYVFSKPSTIEIDLIITNGKTIAIEIKSKEN